ncbi:hypothetical protein F4780DRAFT_548054 [Xylariomycetidae sp. FL0641]|nr:hypothetical protein F4780DRAFT_548054 [Xylariomycetidae sp. FL0641]
MSRSLRRALAGSSLLSAAAMAADTVSFSVNGSPDNASAAVDPSFAGFGIEPSQLFFFMGFSDPNQLTANLLSNLADYTGQPPHVRLGGNTQDYMIYDGSHNAWNIKHNENHTAKGDVAPDSMLIGPRYFEAANRLPQGTPVTWGLNLAYNEDDAVDRVVEMAQQISDRCDNLNLVSFEIGNEVDIYVDHQFRPDSWGGKTYVDQWKTRAAAVYEQVLKPKNISSNFFDAAASTAWVSGTSFTIDDLVKYGITDQAADSQDPYLASWDQHDYYYFLGDTDYPITLDYMMRWPTTPSQFNEALGAQMKQARKTDYPYALREMGVVGPVGQHGVSDTFAAGMWTLNFLMYAATLNISSVQFHLTSNSNASAWQPTQVFSTPAHVRPLYYGMAAFDQTIGASCKARVAQASIDSLPNGYDGYVNAYSVYQGERLGSIVVLNGKLVNETTENKPSLTVSISLPTNLAGETVHLSYLSADGADSQSNVTWNGMSYEANGDGTSSKVSGDDDTVKVKDDGTLTIQVRDTQAVVASIGRRVGSDTDSDEDACSAVITKGLGPTHTAAAGSGNGNDDDKDGAAPGLGGQGVMLSAILAASFALGGALLI